MSDFWIVVVTAIAGVAPGVLSGMFGVGGATISTPAIRAIGATPIAAVASTLPPILPSALSGTIRYHREGLIETRVATYTGLAGIIAAVGGALLTDVIPGNGHPLMLLTAALVGFSAYRLSRPPKSDDADAAAQPAVLLEGETDAGPRALVASHGVTRTEPWRLATIGLVAGLMSGLLGIGGGLVMVPAFSGWVRLHIKMALATSLACVGLLAIPATITHAALGNIDWLYALPLSVGVIPGAQLGAHLTIRSSDQALRVLVGVVLGLIAAGYAVGEILALVD